jgi:hypothetical protein
MVMRESSPPSVSFPLWIGHSPGASPRAGAIFLIARTGCLSGPN